MRKRERSQKKDVKLKTPEDRLLWKLVGVALLVLSVFLALALVSYDWQAAEAGVQILAMDCRVTPDAMVIGESVPVVL